MDGMLSQEEINALFGSMANDDQAASGGEDLEMTEVEKDAVGEISNISMGTAATTLSTLVNNRVDITTPKVSYVTLQDITSQFDESCVFIHISYREGLDGKNLLILKENDVKVITDLMMGGDGTNTEGELSELHLSAISEAMNQMMGSAATSLSSMMDSKVDISPPVASIEHLVDGVSDVDLSQFLSERLVQVAFNIEIGDLVDSQIMQLFPVPFAKEIYSKFSGKTEEETAQDIIQVQEASEEPKAKEPAVTTTESRLSEPAPASNAQPQIQTPPQMMAAPMQQAMQMENVNVQPAQFQNFAGGFSPAMQPENIDLIMDVPLEVTVELGRANKTIKEVLDFSPGTIIELNKLAGEPIDVLVNGKYVAKGEVVVIEESFGIRVTEIVNE